MKTIQITDELLAAAKAYREMFLPKPEEIEKLRQAYEQGGENILSAMGWFVYQLSEAIIKGAESES